MRAPAVWLTRASSEVTGLRATGYDGCLYNDAGSSLARINHVFYDSLLNHAFTGPPALIGALTPVCTARAGGTR